MSRNVLVVRDLPRRIRRESQFHCSRRKLAARMHVQLIQRTLEMIRGGLFGDNQRFGYTSIGQSLRRQLSDFSLAPRELGRGIGHA